MHLHVDGAPFRRPEAFANLVRLFGHWREELWAALGTNPACRRLAPLPDALLDLVEQPGVHRRGGAVRRPHQVRRREPHPARHRPPAARHGGGAHPARRPGRILDRPARGARGGPARPMPRPAAAARRWTTRWGRPVSVDSAAIPVVEPALDDLVRVHLAGLLRYATVLTGDGHTAADLVQEVLLRAHVRWTRIALLERPDLYLRRMVTNEHLSWRRRWHVRTIRPATDEVLAAHADAHGDHADDVVAPGRDVATSRGAAAPAARGAGAPVLRGPQRRGDLPGPGHVARPPSGPTPPGRWRPCVTPTSRPDRSSDERAPRTTTS